jgi:hypothetical protein
MLLLLPSGHCSFYGVRQYVTLRYTVLCTCIKATTSGLAGARDVAPTPRSAQDTSPESASCWFAGQHALVTECIMQEALLQLGSIPAPGPTPAGSDTKEPYLAESDTEPANSWQDTAIR